MSKTHPTSKQLKNNIAKYFNTEPKDCKPYAILKIAQHRENNLLTNIVKQLVDTNQILTNGLKRRK